MKKISCLFIGGIFAGLFVINGCAALPDNTSRAVSHAYTDTVDTYLGKDMAADLEAHPGKSGFVPLSSGLDAFVARAVLAHIAEKSIDAQYYLFHDDLTGRL